MELISVFVSKQNNSTPDNPNLCPYRNAEKADWTVIDPKTYKIAAKKLSALFIGDWNAKVESKTLEVTG